MEFKKYPSVENTYRKKTINLINEMGLDHDEWVVLNKVHGANFSVTFDDDEVKFAKRTSFLTDSDGNFNNYRSVFDPEMLSRLTASYQYLLLRYGKDNCPVTFCGEIAGGSYPHPETKKDPTATRTQKGVFYSPKNFFYLFDIIVDGEFIPHSIVEKIGIMNNLTFAEALFRGTFSECLAYENDFIDPIHKLFNLPTITEGECYEGTDKIKGTITEGVIIKPDQPRFFGNGSRVILKNKNKYFSESAGQKKRTPREPFFWSEEGAKIYSYLSLYINENRLKNVLSHGHEITQKDFGKIMGLLNKDVWGDFIKDHGDTFDSLEVVEQKKIKRQMGRWSADIIRPNFSNIIDGEY